MKLSFSAAGAWAMAKSLIGKLFAVLGSAEVLSMVGSVIAMAVPRLSKEHIAQLGKTLRDLDPDDEGWDDRLGDILIELGGGADAVVTHPTAQIDVHVGDESPPAGG